MNDNTKLTNVPTRQLTNSQRITAAILGSLLVILSGGTVLDALQSECICAPVAQPAAQSDSTGGSANVSVNSDSTTTGDPTPVPTTTNAKP